MEILFILVPVSLVLVMVALAAFVWSVHNHQYDDLDKEAERILFEDPSGESVTPTNDEDK